MQRTLELVKKQLIHPPSYVADNVQYEVITGSAAYGCSKDSSDEDIVGFCIPEKNIIFPHLDGQIEGFGRQKEKFNQFQQHHIKDEGAEKNYDITIYNIVRYFSLCMDNNPNMVDTLYVPQNCVVHCSQIGKMVRDNRDLFLHKGSYHKFCGYSFAQKSKMTNPKENSNRKEDIEKYGYDTKNAYHLVRLIYEAEMILEEGTLDLQRHNEHYKAIRRGELKLEEIEKFYSDKENSLRKLYETSKLRHSPDEAKIKDLLLNCLEHHYGNLSAVVVRQDKYKVLVDKIKELVNAS
jgi:predicted nucleotidyltransferase